LSRHRIYAPVGSLTEKFSCIAVLFVFEYNKNKFLLTSINVNSRALSLYIAVHAKEELC
jgi:hypothetical protein